MAIKQNITLRRGRTGTILVTVTGVDSWTGISAKLVATEQGREGVEVLSLAQDAIDTGTGIIRFMYTYELTNAMVAERYDYEVIIYKDDKTLVQTTTYGALTIKGVVKLDPTI